jgi:tryptophan halogenase
MKINNITVVGGGSAGWLTALILQTYQPLRQITVIESEEIGILGAGEGTVPHFIDVLDKISIPVSDIVKYCKGTIKNGIKFTNWNGDSNFYYHPFRPNTGLNFNELNSIFYDKTLMSIISNLYKEENLQEINFTGKISEECRVPLTPTNQVNAHNANPITQFSRHGNFAMHFDARLLADYLKTVALERGIKRVEGKVTDINSDIEGNIISIGLDNDQIVDCDFVFDCTGFKRMIIGGHFKASWKSHNDVLPVNTAIPFFIENTSTTIEPYTEAVAMKHGWMWKIPVQGRYGCGYVFDDTTTDMESAKQEIRDYLGHDVEFPRTFKFNAGCYEQIWIKNCVAVGLASGFTEPLEATSIWLSTSMLLDLADNFSRLEIANSDDMADYNQSFLERTEDIVDFLALHYMSKRNDSKFWEDYKDRKQSSRLTMFLNKWHNNPPTFGDIRTSIFFLDSWMPVLVGVKQLEKEHVKNFVELSGIENMLEHRYTFYKRNQDHVKLSCIDHYEFLEKLKNG